MADWFVQLWAESLGKHRQPGDARRRPDTARRAGRHRPAQQGAALHGGAADKTVTFIAVEEGGVGRDDSLATFRRAGARLPRRSSSRRAARHRASRDGRRARAARTAEHDAHDRSRRRVARGRAVHVAGDRDGVRRAAVRRESRFDQPGVELGKQFTYAHARPRRRGAGAQGVESAAEAGSAAVRDWTGCSGGLRLRCPTSFTGTTIDASHANTGRMHSTRIACSI